MEEIAEAIRIYKAKAKTNPMPFSWCVVAKPNRPITLKDTLGSSRRWQVPTVAKVSLGAKEDPFAKTVEQLLRDGVEITDCFGEIARQAAKEALENPDAEPESRLDENSRVLSAIGNMPVEGLE